MTNRISVPVLTLDLIKAGNNSCTTSGQIATWKQARFDAVGSGNETGNGTYIYT